jgi:maltooligosyltrehalose trehalohydrolase
MPHPDVVRSSETMTEESPLGASLTANGARFRAYATQVRRVAVRLVDSAGGTLAEHPLANLGEGEYEAHVPGVGNGALYKYVLDDKEVPDPFARFLPLGVNGPAMVSESEYHWQHGLGVSRPLREHVIYELHAGTFTAEGSYRAAIDRLNDLANLGVTAIELMPVGAFPGKRGWGYDGVALFAPFAPYGQPDDLRAFVDAAHGLGLSVFLDVVYNHFGPDGNFLSAFSPEYFSESVKNAWGAAPDFSRPPMRRYVVQNALYWLREFRFDGLRLDATHAISDPSPKHILRELAERIADIRPDKLLIAEDERNDPAVVQEHGLHRGLGGRFSPRGAGGVDR